jgi:hypothetical protein
MESAQKIGFDTLPKVSQCVRELTARFPPFDLRKISANHDGKHSILNQSGRAASNGDSFYDL